MKIHTIKKILMILISLIALLLPADDAGCVELTSEIHDNSTFRMRLLFSQNEEPEEELLSDMKILFIYASEYEKCDDLIFGFSSPVILFGPVSRYGLFRETDNPCGYAPGSSIFDEESGLKLNCSFEPGSSRFLSYALLPGHVLFFLRTVGGMPFSGGSLLQLTLAELVNLELLYTFTGPRDEKESDEWFFDTLPAASGLLHHLSVKVFLKTKQMLVSLTGGLSGGDLILPGYFLQGFLSLEFGCVTPSLLYAYCSDDYTATDGEYKEKMIRTGGKLLLEPASFLDISTVYYLDIDHPSLLSAMFFPITHTINSSIDAEFGIGKKSDFVLTLDHQSTIAFDEAGEKNEKHTIGLASGIQGECIGFKPCLEITAENDDALAFSCGIDFSLDAYIHSLSSQQMFYIIEDSLSYKGSIEYSARDGGFTGWCSLSMKKPFRFSGDDGEKFVRQPFDFLSINIGFKVSS